MATQARRPAELGAARPQELASLVAGPMSARDQELERETWSKKALVAAGLGMPPAVVSEKGSTVQ